LRLGDPEVGHDLLELVLVPGVVECAARAAKRRGAGLALDDRPAAAEVAGAVEVCEGHGDALVVERGIVAILLVGQVLVAAADDGVGKEDLGTAGGTA